MLKAMQQGQPDVTLGPFQAEQLPATALLAGPSGPRANPCNQAPTCIIEVRNNESVFRFLTHHVLLCLHQFSVIDAWINARI